MTDFQTALVGTASYGFICYVPTYSHNDRFLADRSFLKLIIFALITASIVEKFSLNQTGLHISFSQNIVRALPCTVSCRSYHLSSAGEVALCALRH